MKRAAFNPNAGTISIDSQQTGAPINPFIYGQFIEHLGRCIYGGIWAEMLEDRKFYYKPTPNLAPYTQLEDTDFPVVGASPWEIVGDPDGMLVVTEKPFVGKHSLMVKSGTGLRQNDLGVVAGKSYSGYIWVRSTGSTPAGFSVSLHTPTREPHVESVNLQAPSGNFVKLGYTFTASATSDQVSLEVNAEEGDIVVGTLSLMPADNVDGMRADTLKLLRELGGTIYRWPGGNFTSGYDWHDGIGDRDLRPPRKNPAWTGVEHNDFGTDEFMAFCRAVHAEPMIAVNTGLGDAYSAAQWVEYCNGSADTLAGGWRADNGHADAYAVKHWCVGNEMYGPWQLGFMSLAHYQLKHNQVAEAMREVDASIELAAVGCFDAINKDYDPDQAKSGIPWSKGMLMECGDHMEYISEHFYCGRLPWEECERLSLAESVVQMKTEIRKRADVHRKLQPELPQLKGRLIPITMDEWNYWHRNYEYGELGCPYDMADGLGIAEGLHEYFRQSDLIQMAFYAQTVNVIGAIKTSRTEAEMETTGLVLAMYRKRFGVHPLQLSGVAEPLDAVAAKTADGRQVSIAVVNPTSEARQLELEGNYTQADCWSISAPDEFAHNVPGAPRSVDILEECGLDVSAGLPLRPFSVSIFLVPTCM